MDEETRRKLLEMSKSTHPCLRVVDLTKPKPPMTHEILHLCVSCGRKLSRIQGREVREQSNPPLLCKACKITIPAKASMIGISCNLYGDIKVEWSTLSTVEKYKTALLIYNAADCGQRERIKAMFNAILDEDGIDTFHFRALIHFFYSWKGGSSSKGANLLDHLNDDAFEQLRKALKDGDLVRIKNFPSMGTTLAEALVNLINDRPIIDSQVRRQISMMFSEVKNSPEKNRLAELRLVEMASKTGYSEVDMEKILFTVARIETPYNEFYSQNPQQRIRGDF